MQRDKILALVKKIPKGNVTTYKELANALDSKGYRAVGKILNSNRDTNIPCYKVVKSDGTVGGYNRGTKKKLELLKREGINFGNTSKPTFFSIPILFPPTFRINQYFINLSSLYRLRINNLSFNLRRILIIFECFNEI